MQILFNQRELGEMDGNMPTGKNRSVNILQEVDSDGESPTRIIVGGDFLNGLVRNSPEM